MWMRCVRCAGMLLCSACKSECLVECETSEYFLFRCACVQAWIREYRFLLVVHVYEYAFVDMYNLLHSYIRVRANVCVCTNVHFVNRHVFVNRHALSKNVTGCFDKHKEVQIIWNHPYAFTLYLQSLNRRAFTVINAQKLI